MTDIGENPCQEKLPEPAAEQPVTVSLAGLNDLQSRVLADYVRHMADLLELRDWTIILSPDPPEDEARAEIDPMAARKIATLKLDPGTATAHRMILRHVVCHELVHCHQQPMADVVEQGLHQELGGSAYHLFYEGFRLALERATDAIAEALSPGLPLIDWEREGHAATCCELWTEEGGVYLLPYRPGRAADGATVSPGEQTP